ncbi:hypothetical protein DV738_g1161, partial [Chaetothyriales sp. CBS 135597]
MASSSVDAPVDSPAQQLLHEHEALEAKKANDHHVTVEDAVDEDDIQHPPPTHTLPTEATPPAANGTLSAKAAGKQKVADKPGVPDTQDEEAFPSLAPAPKPALRSTGWGANSAVKAAKPNGASSKTGTSNAQTANPPPSSAPRAHPPVLSSWGTVNLPGRYRDSFEIDNRDIDRSKTVRKVLEDAKKKYNVVITTQSTGLPGRTAFVAEGTKQQSVTEALMYISKELTVDKTETLNIPVSVSSQIIGRGGANIKKLESQFNVRIQIDKDAKTTDPDTATVVIKGHSAGVRQVYEQISNQAKALQPTVDLPVRDIPPELFPFLAGPHNSQVQKLQQDRDLQIHIPDFYRRQQTPPTREEGGPLFIPHGNSHIHIFGDQAAARQAQADLQLLARQIQEQLVLEELAAEQILHPYIVGDRGVDPLEFSARTGCAIVLPPDHHDSDEVHIIGPRDRIQDGIDYATELMSKKHNRAIDLQKQFQDAPQGHSRHSRALAQYLQRKAIDREFRHSHGAEIMFPSHASSAPAWNVIHDDPTKALAARNELHKIAQAYPTPRIQLVEVDPFFHPHLQALHENSFQNLGVHMIVPDSGEDAVVLVYEGPRSDSPFSFPRTRPTPSDIQNFERALQQAEAQLKASIPHQGISQSQIHVPQKHYDRVRKFADSYPKPARPNSFPVQVDFGDHYARDDQIFLRGPESSDIADLQKAIEKFLLEVEEEEKERSYTTSFDFPSKFNKNLIGKGGQNINSLREKHDVDIDTRENGKVKIQGPPKKAEACKAEILKTLRQWEDEVNYVIKIDPKYHGMLVGRNGENLRRLQTNTNNLVRIDFPRISKAADDASVGDNASEAGGPRQAVDEIKIRGPKAKADQVRSELLDLKAYLEENSYTATVSVDSKQIGSLIGRGGQEMEKLRVDTGAQIDIPKGDNGPRTTIQLKGTKQQVEKAKAELQKRAREFDSIVVKTINVDRKHHKTLIGQAGQNIQGIVSRAGAPGSSAEHVRFPRQGEESDSLTIKGTQDVVDKILKEIEAFVDEKENSVTEVVDVPVSSHRNLIGPGGANRIRLEKDFGVSINVPRQGTGQTGVKITGRPENVTKAKEHISSSAAGHKGETVIVPRASHHALDRDGAFKRELSKIGITIDHQGHREPKKPSVSRRAASGKLPLITDQQTDDVQHSWETVVFTTDEEGDIPWTIYAQNKDDEALANAKQQIEEALIKASQDPVIGYLTLEDPGLHGRIVGRGGSKINQIRDQSGCEVQVPKGKAGSEPITIVGSRDGVNQAYELILKAIREGQ